MSTEKTITAKKKWSIVFTALVFDVLGLIPFAGVVLNAFGYVVVYGWLWLYYGLNPYAAFSEQKHNWLWFGLEWGLYFAGFSFIPGLTLNAYSSASLITEGGGGAGSGEVL